MLLVVKATKIDWKDFPSFFFAYRHRSTLLGWQQSGIHQMSSARSSLKFILMSLNRLSDNIFLLQRVNFHLHLNGLFFVQTRREAAAEGRWKYFSSNSISIKPTQEGVLHKRMIWDFDWMRKMNEIQLKLVSDRLNPSIFFCAEILKNRSIVAYDVLEYRLKVKINSVNGSSSSCDNTFPSLKLNRVNPLIHAALLSSAGRTNKKKLKQNYMLLELSVFLWGDLEH